MYDTYLLIVVVVVGLSTFWLNSLCQGDEHPAYDPSGVWPTFTFCLGLWVSEVECCLMLAGRWLLPREAWCQWEQAWFGWCWTTASGRGHESSALNQPLWHSWTRTYWPAAETTDKDTTWLCVCFAAHFFCIFSSFFVYLIFGTCCRGRGRISPVHFLARWCKWRHEPDFSFVRFSFTYVTKQLSGLIWFFFRELTCQTVIAATIWNVASWHEVTVQLNRSCDQWFVDIADLLQVTVYR